MQTFLPYPDFAASAAVLDGPRLGKQRVETLQILRALELPDYGWQNHPAVVMWRGRTPALVGYGLACVREWCRRGHPDSTETQIAEFAPDVHAIAPDELQSELARRGLLPAWLGDELVHRSHRSRLIAKDPDFYRPLFPDAPADLDYVWPPPDPVDVPQLRADLDVLWVLRPESPAALGAFLLHGVVGFGAASGAAAGVGGLDDDEVRDLLGLTSRVFTRPVAALLSFARDLRPGDRVAVEIEQGGRLLTGEVVGDYAFAARADGWQHHRTTRWERVVARSAVAPPSSLQDVRPLFPVRLGRDRPRQAG